MKSRRYRAAVVVMILSLCGFGSESFAQVRQTDSLITYYQQLLTRNPRNSKAY